MWVYNKIIILSWLVLFISNAIHSSCAYLHEIMQRRPDISYLKCHDAMAYNYKRLPVSPLPVSQQPHQGMFNETFVVTIPNGQVLSDWGMIKVDNNLVLDFFPQNAPVSFLLNGFFDKKIDNSDIIKVSGRVAVISHTFHMIFGHWFNEIVGRLIILQQSGIEYDWLYAPKYAPYMKTTYELYNIDLDKIIDPLDGMIAIQADELIVPSLTMRRVPCATDPVLDVWPTTDFWPTWITDDVRSKYLPIVQEHMHEYNFSKKIFISRQDASGRHMLNEDEVFALFEPLGFKRYCLSSLSALEQAILFYGADYIVAAHGSGLTNMIFCQPHTKVLEIFQHLYDASLYNLAQDMKCDYFCLKTVPDSLVSFVGTSTMVPINLIEQYIKHYFLDDKNEGKQ